MENSLQKLNWRWDPIIIITEVNGIAPLQREQGTTDPSLWVHDASPLRELCQAS
jgi:hypothetical protein